MTSFATAAAASGRENCRERLRIRRSWLRGSEAPRPGLISLTRPDPGGGTAALARESMLDGSHIVNHPRWHSLTHTS